MSIRSTSLCRASIRQLTHQFAQSSFHRPTLFSPRTFTTSTFKMAPPAPAGLFSNRYKLEDIPDLSGKVAVVTGGTRGIGESLVAALAKKNAEIHILGAQEQHGQEAIEKVSNEAPGSRSKLHFHQVDLGSLQNVLDLIPTLAGLPRIDMLYLIAGIGVAPFGLTKDGLGNHFAVNHLAHFLLVDGLLPKMIETSKQKAATGDDMERWSTRIVAESSELHRASPSDVKCESVEEFSHEIDPTKLYGRSKLLDMLFIKELVKHLPPLDSPNPILALSVHPGAVATEQQKGATQAYGIVGKLLEGAASLGFMDPSQGAESASWAGTSPNVGERREEVQGQYFTEADGKVGTESEQGKSEQLAKNLWDLSVKTLKEKVNYDVKM